MREVDEIIQAFGGTGPFRQFFGIPKPTIHTWRRRNYFPPTMDVDLITEAQRRKIKLTYEDLARMRHKTAGMRNENV